MDNFDDFLNDLESFVDKVEDDVESALRYAANKVVTDARELRTYTDRTGNLRASIGFSISENGQVVEDHIPDIPGSQGKTAATRMAQNTPKGHAVQIVAGMPYGTYVEAKGYDVVTGPAMRFDEYFREANKR